MKYRLFVSLVLFLFLASCKKKKNSDTPFSGTISITYPAANDTVHGGDSFVITGTISANKEMHGYHILVYNETDQSVVYENQYHLHAFVFTVNETVAHTLNDTTPLRLVVEGAGDHESEIFSKEILFTYLP